MAKDDLISRAAVLDAIEDLQHSPWYGDEKDTAYHHRYLTRKEAVEIVRDLAVKSVPTVDAVPVEWLWQAQDKMLSSSQFSFEECAIVGILIRAWHKEQETQDG